MTRRACFKSRHAKNIAKGKRSAAFWSDRVKWSLIPIGGMILLLSGGVGHAKLQQVNYNSLLQVQAVAAGER
jgi:hypothetical protein